MHIDGLTVLMCWLLVGVYTLVLVYQPGSKEKEDSQWLRLLAAIMIIVLWPIVLWKEMK